MKRLREILPLDEGKRINALKQAVRNKGKFDFLDGPLLTTPTISGVISAASGHFKGAAAQAAFGAGAYGVKHGIQIAREYRRLRRTKKFK